MVGLSRMDHVGWVYWRPPRANPVQKDEHFVEKDGLTFGLVRDMVLENRKAFIVMSFKLFFSPEFMANACRTVQCRFLAFCLLVVSSFGLRMGENSKTPSKAELAATAGAHANICFLRHALI